MTQQAFEISFERNPVYECGATLLTVLTCAGARNCSAERQDELHASLCGRALWDLYLANPDDIAPIYVRPQHVFRDRKAIDRDVAFVGKRLGERMVAGRMAVPFLWAAELGCIPILPKGIRRLSVNELAAFVMEDAEQVEPNNVEQRIWTPSRPVIHLAAAAAVVGQEWQKRGAKMGMELYLQNQDFLHEVLLRAERFAGLISACPQFPVKAERLIRIRLV